MPSCSNSTRTLGSWVFFHLETLAQFHLLARSTPRRGQYKDYIITVLTYLGSAAAICSARATDAEPTDTVYGVRGTRTGTQGLVSRAARHPPKATQAPVPRTQHRGPQTRLGHCTPTHTHKHTVHGSRGSGSVCYAAGSGRKLGRPPRTRGYDCTTLVGSLRPG